MISSEHVHAALPLAVALVLIPLQLGCIEPEPTGDLSRFGCPDGEVCTPGAIDLVRSAAYRCGGMVPTERAPSMGSTAVALGGRTTASASADPAWWGTGPTVDPEFTREFETSYALHDSMWVFTGRAVSVGTGRFSVRGYGGGIIDYIRMPVLEAHDAVVSDGVACPEEERVLLRGATVSLRPVVLAEDGTALVDLDATLRALSGEASVTPGPRSDRVTFRLRYGGGLESLESLSVIDEVDRIEAAQSPLDRVRRGPIELSSARTRVCFRAFSGSATVLGLDLDAASTDDERVGVSVDGPCVQLADPSAFVRDGSPSFDVAISVRMAGIDTEVTVRVPERATDD